MPAPPPDAGLRYRPRIKVGASQAEIVTHFLQRFDLGVRHVDEHTGRAVEVGARPLTWPEAHRLDQLLRMVPVRFVRGNPKLGGLVLVDRNAVGRTGGYRPHEQRIVIYRPGQALAVRDEVVPTNSVFVATIAHELGEAAWEAVLSPEERERYARRVALGVEPRASEEFANLFMRGILTPSSIVPLTTRAFLRDVGLPL